MKFILPFVLLVTSCAAFGVQPRSNAFCARPLTVSTSTTAVQMGLFDFFSEDARKEREERKRLEYEEQERAQRQIMERRNNPDAMAEYEAKVRVRRNLRMAGMDDKAETIKLYETKDEE
mmetsp:Transcript_49129/g.73000  ORF Transcript_49129/g.73000 Transcript_49129/m.73000 type:complete len:119 (-) Transcript_49129:215-571(-)|eukprot:CAMPEP_0195515750 /NCGR_PEP_ID=MMETSP0794_2-20130614/6711_1 /TAXON_ID=515487 /ORGANISM="Stephanopyxis turris, Strain CCMP 815" /LENGTH=118 /DNA_ID=CAMNT_0040644225 /DNA_START=60 /DNA_END=416 /DNA_ORIENTATION=-